MNDTNMTPDNSLFKSVAKAEQLEIQTLKLALQEALDRIKELEEKNRDLEGDNFLLRVKLDEQILELDKRYSTAAFF